jgi:hypothetical protein
MSMDLASEGLGLSTAVWRPVLGAGVFLDDIILSSSAVRENFKYFTNYHDGDAVNDSAFFKSPQGLPVNQISGQYFGALINCFQIEYKTLKRSFIINIYALFTVSFIHIQFWSWQHLFKNFH